MTIHSLELFDNATDSLNEALRQFQSASSANPGPFKFAILHFSHFLELLLKYHISQAHPLLIYKNPFSKSIRSEQTIGLWEAIQFLKNEGRPVDEEFRKDLEWLKSLRNTIEHHKFTMETKEVRRVLGRLIRATLELNEEFVKVDLARHVDEECLETFNTLADEYQAQLESARDQAQEESLSHEGHDCAWCDEKGVAVFDGKSYRCLLCKAEDRVVECARCGESYRGSEVSPINEEPGEEAYLCESCDDYIMSQD